MATFEISMPGAFITFWTGTGVVSGDPYSDDPDEERGARELREAWLACRSVKRGRGLSYKLTLPSPDAVLVLLGYAATCIMLNETGSDEPDHSELGAARKVFARCEQALERAGYRVVMEGYGYKAVKA